MDWSTERQLLVDRAVPLAPGLTDAELAAAEAHHGFRFPPDLRSLLASFLPVGQSFPDWRDPGSERIASMMRWPLEGMVFDIENGVFWWPAWGPVPPSAAERFERARVAVAEAPRLIPVYGHRYLPAEPCESGNPVFSVHQMDIILYGDDLRAYWACEHGGLPYERAVSPAARRIRFWSDVAS